MKKRILACLLVVMVVVGCLPAELSVARGTAPSGIKGNGTSGISININASPFTEFANYSDASIIVEGFRK